MNRYSWNFNEHEEVWQNSCPTIEDCIEEAKWEKEDREIAENHVFIGDVEPYKPFIRHINLGRRESIKNKLLPLKIKLLSICVPQSAAKVLECRTVITKTVRNLIVLLFIIDMEVVSPCRCD